MKCACGQAANPTDQFCRSCGKRIAGAPSQTFNTGDISGVVIGWGYNINIGQGTLDHPRPKVSAEPVWRSPFTQGVLQWAGVILAVLSLLPIAGILKFLLDFLTDLRSGNLGATATSIGDSFIIVIMLAFMLLVISRVFVLRLGHIVKNRLRIPLFSGWALSGKSGRVTLERVRAEGCPQCGGRMRYYNAPIWREYRDSSGELKREVEKRVPTLECQRNPEQHSYRVDPAKDD